MPPSQPAEDGESGRDRLFALRTCLNDLQTAMQGGHWELLEQLAPHLGNILQQLNKTQTSLGNNDADELRRLLGQVKELQANANARQQQIGPLLSSWRISHKVDDTPAP